MNKQKNLLKMNLQLFASGDPMPATDYTDIIREAINQSLGDDYLEVDDSTGELRPLKSYDIVTIGKDISASQMATERFTKALVARIGSLVIHSREFVGRHPWIYRKYDEWGSFTEHVWFGLGEIMDDPSLSPIDGHDYSDIEHKFYGTKVKVQLFGKDGGYMTPISIQTRQLKQAMTSWNELNSFIAGIQTMVTNTLAQAYEVFVEMIYADAIALIAKGTQKEIPLVTLYNMAFPDDIVTILTALDNPKFVAFCCKTIALTVSRMQDYTTAFNNGEIPVFSRKDTLHTTLLDVFDNAMKFDLKPYVYNRDELNFGDYDTVSKWQGYKKTGKADYDFETISKIMIDADPNNTLGLGTEPITVENVIGITCDEDGIGFTYRYEDTTSSYTGSADFTNYFHHRQCYGMVNTTANMVIYTLN